MATHSLWLCHPQVVQDSSSGFSHTGSLFSSLLLVLTPSHFPVGGFEATETGNRSLALQRSAPQAAADALFRGRWGRAPPRSSMVHWQAVRGHAALKWPTRREQLGPTTKCQQGESQRAGFLSQPWAAGLKVQHQHCGTAPRLALSSSGDIQPDGELRASFRGGTASPTTWDCASQGCHNRAVPHQSLSPTSHTSA